MASNPVSVPVPTNVQGGISCAAYAANFQRVTLSVDGVDVIFSGSGEGVSMVTQSGDSVYLLPQKEGAYTISALFEFSTSGSGGPFTRASVKDPVVSSKGVFTTIEVTSEDQNDNDYNDSYLTITYVNSYSRSERIDSGKIATVQPSVESGGGQLELHAKTYYNDPNEQGGDEHYFTVPYTGSNIYYSGTSWQMYDGEFYIEQTPLGGYVNVIAVLYKSSHPDFQGASLSFYTRLGYWGSKPTGYATVNWSAELNNSKYSVTRVTN